MTTPHTPTPWKVKEGTMDFLGDSMRPIQAVHGSIIAFVSDGNLVDTQKRDADASFICRAVNAHEELVGMVKELLSELSWTAQNNPQHGLEGTVEKAKKVLAKAEGK